jgi:hypothetical protein
MAGEGSFSANIAETTPFARFSFTARRNGTNDASTFTGTGGSRFSVVVDMFSLPRFDWSTGYPFLGLVIVRFVLGWPACLALRGVAAAFFLVGILCTPYFL